MITVWAVVLILFGALAWLGQLISILAPAFAAKIGLFEKEGDVDPAYFTMIRGEALWDSFTLWTLPLAGVLLLIKCPYWPLWGLIGGGIYVYYAGLGIAYRISCRKNAVAIGGRKTVAAYFVFLAMSGLLGLGLVVHSFLSLA